MKKIMSVLVLALGATIVLFSTIVVPLAYTEDEFIVMEAVVAFLQIMFVVLGISTGVSLIWYALNRLIK
jgi:hypothetical protein